MILDIDLFAVGEFAFHLLGENGRGGEAPDQLRTGAIRDDESSRARTAAAAKRLINCVRDSEQ